MSLLQNVYPVKLKLVISGNFLELYEYEKPYWVGFPRIKSFRNVIPKLQSSVREDNVRRTRQKLRRLVNCNVQLDRFFTITFAENMTDLKESGRLFSAFVKRLRRLYPDFQYIGVPEFQKRGAIHYHFLCNLPFIDMNQLSELWGHGFCFLRKVSNVDNLGAYISKYLTKEIFDRRFFRVRKFYYSANIKRPIVLDRIVDIFRFLKKIPSCFIKKQFNIEVLTKYLGMVKYRQLHISSLLKVEYIL